MLARNLILAPISALWLSIIAGPSWAQSETRVCLPSYAANGAMSCQDITAAFPLPVVVTPSSTSGATHAQCAALCANLVVDANPGDLFSFNVSADSTLSAAAWWIMVYDATAAPGDGAVTPAKCYAMTSGTTSFSAAFPVPATFTTGITFGVSTTGCFSKTASTHAFIAGDFK